MKKIIVILSVILMGCGSNERLNTTIIAEEMKDRNVRKITQNQIVDAAIEFAHMITDEQSEYLEDYELKSNDFKDSVEYVMSSKIQIVKDDSFTPQKADKLSMIIDAYRYNAQKQLALDENIQFLEQDILYTKPIVIEGKLKAYWVIYINKAKLIREIDS